MIVQLDEKARQVLEKSGPLIITERVDDVALLLGQMVKMGLAEILDRHSPNQNHRIPIQEQIQ